MKSLIVVSLTASLLSGCASMINDHRTKQREALDACTPVNGRIYMASTREDLAYAVSPFILDGERCRRIGAPLAWAVIGSTAAFALGVTQDLGLVVAALSGVYLLLRRTPPAAGSPAAPSR